MCKLTADNGGLLYYEQAIDKLEGNEAPKKLIDWATDTLKTTSKFLKDVEGEEKSINEQSTIGFIARTLKSNSLTWADIDDWIIVIKADPSSIIEFLKLLFGTEHNKSDSVEPGVTIPSKRALELIEDELKSLLQK